MAKDNRRLLYFLLPFFIIYFSFSFFPILYSFIISFTKWDGIGEMDFIGLNNYKRALTNELFYKSIFNTLLFMVIAIPLQIATGLLIAAFIKDNVKRGKRFFQTANFLPYLTAPIAIGLMFQLFFDYKRGTVNDIAIYLNIIEKGIYWLGTQKTARIVMIILVYWKYFGYMSVIFMTGLSTVPHDVLEAAQIDGASWMQRFFKIELPILKPIIIFVVITCIIGGFQLFSEPMSLFRTANASIGGPDNGCLTIVMNFYQISFKRFELGYGSSIAFLLFIMIFTFSMISLKIMKRGDES